MPALQRAGDVRIQHGDLCAARAVTATEAAKERASVIAHSISELKDPDTALVLVDIPGRTSRSAVPKFVVEAIQRAARR